MENVSIQHFKNFQSSFLIALVPEIAYARYELFDFNWSLNSRISFEAIP